MKMQPKQVINYIRIGVIGLIVLILVFGSFTIISAGHVGVVTRLGAVNRVVSPGLIFKIPLVESVNQMETRTQKEQVDAAAASKDLQEVKYYGINRFPALVIKNNESNKAKLIRGYHRFETIVEIISDL